METEPDYDSKNNDEFYQDFIEFLDEKNEEKAYDLLKENPDLIKRLRLDEVSDCYLSLLRGVGEGAAFNFLRIYIGKVREVIIEDIPFSNALYEIGDNFNLEKILQTLSDKHKEMLEDMENRDK